ncbi:outer membrane protein assembly factor BamB family protein [Natrinema sp. LN54]|uniref:outer membrane protein assembly factor BamB family protein n=1 Tax=Natrinema sp. LN54 TaxID=3458705 RepID=UPI0040375B06
MNTDKSNTTGNGTADELPASEWPMYGVDPQNTGYHPTATGPTGDDVERKTFYEAEEAVSNSPAIIGETLYTATDDYLSAVDISTGERKWKKQVTGLQGYYPVVDDERVYVGTDNGIAAVDRGGTELSWRNDVGISTVEPVVADSSIVGAENMILYRFHPETGTETILHDLRDYEGGRPYTDIPAYDDGTVYFAGGHILYAIDVENGEVKWTFENPEEKPMGESDPAVADETVYIGGEDQCLYAISTEDGEEEWSIEINAKVECSPSIADGTVYFGGSDSGRQQFFAIDTDSQKHIWDPKELQYSVRSKPVVANDIVYITSYRDIFAFNSKDGSTEWEIKNIGNGVEDSLSTTPVISGGSVYVSTRDGKIHELEGM